MAPQGSQPSEEDPYAAHQSTEQETVHQAVQDRQTGSNSAILMWPTIGGAPINEFNTEGYFSVSFPTLFPTGAADSLASGAIRLLLVTTSNI